MKRTTIAFTTLLVFVFGASLDLPELASSTRAQAATENTTGVPLFSPDGGTLPNGHIVFGSVFVPAGSGATVTFAGSAAFSNPATYACFFTDRCGPYQKIDGKQMKVPRMSDAAGATIQYACVGN